MHPLISRLACIPLLAGVAACGRGVGEAPPVVEDKKPAITQPSTPPGKAFAPTPEAALGTLPAQVGLAKGERIPDATLEDSQGKPASLTSIRAGFSGPWLLIVFYRGGWCPYCNYEIHELTQAFPDFEKRGALPVVISVDRPEKAAETRATYKIPFPVLSDPDLRAHAGFSVVRTADAQELERLKGMGIDLEAASGRAHHQMAIPSLFLVDRAGIVRWAHADRDYKTRPTTAQLLSVIDGLSGS